MNKLRTGRILQALAFVGLLTPFFLLLLIRKDVYFSTATDTLKISLGVIIGIAYALILVIKAISEVNKYVKPLIALVVFTIITYLFKSIINDLFIILLTLVIGYLIFLILMTIASKLIDDGKEYKKTFIREKAKRDYAENIKVGGNV